MTNRLNKRVDVTYRPAVPYQPAVPAYCVLVPYEVPGYQHIDIITTPQGGLVEVPGPYTPPRTVYVDQCFPRVPAVQAVPESVTYSVPQGWNAGARSVSQLDADGYVTFKVVDPVVAVVVGFSATDTTTLPAEQTHAFYVHGAQVQVMESGTVVATASVAHAGANVYRIERHGVTVTYSVGGWSYVSTVQSGGAVVLDASLYAASDYVDTPVLAALTAPVGYGAGALFALQGYGHDSSTYADGVGALRAFRGVGAGATLNAGGGTMRGLLGTGSNIVDYSWGDGALPALTGVGDAGYPLFATAEGIGAVPMLAGVGLGLVGEIGAGVGKLRSLAGYGADAHGYAEGVGSLGAMYGYGDEGWPIPNEVNETDVLLMGDFAIAQDVQIGRVSEGLHLTDTYFGAKSIDAVYVDALLLDDSLTMVRAIEATIMSGMLLGNTVAPLLALALEPTQYAVNTLSGALTTYVNFGFDSFTRAGQQLYGAMADGVYRVRAGSDNGVPITATMDFGQLEFGGLTAKSIETVFLGLSTDGQVYLRMRADNGLETVFMARERGPSFRINGSKRVAGRRWNITLEVVDATDLALDSAEYCVFDTKRRWTSLR